MYAVLKKIKQWINMFLFYIEYVYSLHIKSFLRTLFPKFMHLMNLLISSHHLIFATYDSYCESGEQKKLIMVSTLLVKGIAESFKYTFHCMKNVQIRTYFWPAFSRIRIEYGKICRILPDSVRMRENMGQE